ncbi:MAG: hypothetical protein R3351_05755 [Nitrospirales bacterium]|nr:hypothetical protein [Nitrospirales bacterium]
MLVKYCKLGNSGFKKKETDLSDFLLEFPFMFVAGLIPPFQVVLDLCNSNPSSWGASNKVRWKKFLIDLEQYKCAVDEITKVKGYEPCVTPDSIDSAYKWSLWQYEVKFGVPYDKYKALCDREIILGERMLKAKKEGKESVVIECHVELSKLAGDINDFLDGFIN